MLPSFRLELEDSGGVEQVEALDSTEVNHAKQQDTSSPIYEDRKLGLLSLSTLLALDTVRPHFLFNSQPVHTTFLLMSVFHIGVQSSKLCNCPSIFSELVKLQVHLDCLF